MLKLFKVALNIVGFKSTQTYIFDAVMKEGTESLLEFSEQRPRFGLCVPTVEHDIVDILIREAGLLHSVPVAKLIVKILVGLHSGVWNFSESKQLPKHNT